MIQWLKRLFTKKTKIILDCNFTEALHSIKNKKAIVGKPFTIVIKPNDGFELDFVRVYRQRMSDETELDCITTINNIAIIKYTPTEYDDRVIVQSSARLLSPADFVEPSYEIVCDEFLTEIPKSGDVITLNPYVIKKDYFAGEEEETIINYDPEKFSIELKGNNDWILDENKIVATYNDSDERIIGDVCVSYKNVSKESQIYQE